MNYHQKCEAQQRKERLLKVRNANERQTILQSLAFSISSKVNAAANQADIIVASMIVDVRVVDHGRLQSELLT